MKVLFAVSNENISTQIVKKYQKEYKEIISFKNMYYFNAIVKELQRDKSYDRIVISEDLEPFANNNYDAIDKFLFEKLDNISDEATGMNGEDIPIILISTDRRTKSEPILVKLFGIGIYNVLVGQDRSTSNVCALLNKPRSKKEAKIYYKIESDEVSYKSESEETVSETEINNIRNHYKRLGKDEERYIESFNNIAAQYTDAQLRIITRFLPLNVKAVLEEKSPKYQSVMTFGDTSSTINAMNKKKQEEGLKIGFLDNGNSSKPVKPVIVPTAVKKVAIKKIGNSNRDIIKPKIQENEEKEIEFENFDRVMKQEQHLQEYKDIKEENNNEEIIQPIKKGRGRPKKVTSTLEEEPKEIVPKRGRGRPKKVTSNLEEVVVDDFNDLENDTAILPGFENSNDVEDTFQDFNNSKEDVTTLPGFDEVEEVKNVFPDFDELENDKDILPGFDELEDGEDVLPGFDDLEDGDILPGFDLNKNEDTSAVIENKENTKYNPLTSNIGLLSKDRKIVSFVGTTKNGTSFLVNNLAKSLSSMGIKTAILDLTKNKNSYYIFTKNEEKLRDIAFESIKNLRDGIANGIPVDKCLDVYTALPGDKQPLENVEEIVSTLLQNYSVILMDCDFNTPSEYFEVAQEIYVVQTMDILTIQPMTAFMRDLKAKDILKPDKIKIVINKEIKVKGLTPKTIVGGLAFYNDPAMSFMTELFNKETVKFCTIPFEEEVYAKYLEGVMDCEIRINGYSRSFNAKLKELSNMVYPLVGVNKYKSVGDYSNNYKFSKNMNDTLQQMKNKY